MSRFLTVCSARYELPVKPTPDPEQAQGGSVVFFGGTDADYPSNGIPQRRKSERHWLGVWRDERDVSRFFSSPTTHLPQLAEAQDAWGLKLIPYMRRGAEIIALDVHHARPAPEDPVAIITSIGSYASESDVLAAGQKASAARQSLVQADGLMQELLLIPYPPMATDLFTITVWRSERAAQAWAYRGDTHRHAMEFYKTTTEKPRVSFTRCTIDDSFGAWQRSHRPGIDG